MAAALAGPGGPLDVHGRGFFSRAAERLRHLLGIGWSESAAPEADCAPPGAVFAPPAEGMHQARFTVDELDACIEDSIRKGCVNLEATRAAEVAAAEQEPGPRRKLRATLPASKPIGEARTFGGDLYPTAAHRIGRHVRQVRDSTWTNPAGIPARVKPPQAGPGA